MRVVENIPEDIPGHARTNESMVYHANLRWIRDTPLSACGWSLPARKEQELRHRSNRTERSYYCSIRITWTKSWSRGRCKIFFNELRRNFSWDRIKPHWDWQKCRKGQCRRQWSFPTTGKVIYRVQAAGLFWINFSRVYDIVFHEGDTLAGARRRAISEGTDIEGV